MEIDVFLHVWAFRKGPNIVRHACAVGRNFGLVEKLPLIHI